MKTVGTCETQPITAEGLRVVVSNCPELEFQTAANSLMDGAAMLRDNPPDILVVDKGFGAQAVLAWVAEI